MQRSFTPVDAVLLSLQGFSIYSLFSAMLANEKMNSTYFALHPKAAILGVSSTLLGGYIMASKAKRGMSKRLLIHQLLTGVGSLSVYFAIFRIYNNKVMNNRKHLQTPHAWLGATAGVALLGLNVGTAYLQYGTEGDKRRGYKWHRIIATASLATLTAATITGTIATFKPDSSTTKQIAAGVIGALATLVASAQGLI
jgi:hypothetical protein